MLVAEIGFDMHDLADRAAGHHTLELAHRREAALVIAEGERHIRFADGGDGALHLGTRRAITGKQQAHASRRFGCLVGIPGRFAEEKMGGRQADGSGHSEHLDSLEHDHHDHGGDDGQRHQTHAGRGALRFGTQVR